MPRIPARREAPRGESVPSWGAHRMGEDGWPLTCLTSSQVCPFRVVSNFLTRRSALWGRLGLFCLRPGLSRNRGPGFAETIPLRRRRVETSGGWGPPCTMRAPWSAARNSLNPSCWNARQRRLFHSGPNVFVITPDRSPAPPLSPPARGTQSERTAGLAPAVSHTSLTQQIALELPKPSPKPVLGWFCLHRSAESGPGSHQAQRRPVITRGWLAPCAPGRHPRSGLLQAIPSHLPRLRILSRAPLGALLSQPLPVLQPRSTPPTAAISRQTANEE